MTLGIAHREQDVTVLDVLLEVKAPFDPESAVSEFCKTLHEYYITRVTGDQA
jgi:hypothetical protein